MAWKNAKGGFVYWLNRLLNPDHPWTDYYDPTTGEDVLRVGAGSLKGDQPTYGVGSLSSNSLLGTLGKGIEALITKWTDAGATGGEIQRNEMQMQNAEDIYQRQVTGMQKAGVNPALMYGSGAPTPPSVNTSSSGAASMSDLAQLFMLPLQKKLMLAQAQQARDTGEAALINARANAGRLPIEQEGNEIRRSGVDVQRYEAETNRMKLDLERLRADKQFEVSDAQIQEIAERAALLRLQREQLPQQLAIAQQNADSQQKSAFASLKQADAAQRNAAINEKLSVPQEQILWCEKVIKWYESEGKRIFTEKLPEQIQLQLENLRKEGVLLDSRGALVNNQGDLVTGQTYRTWVSVASAILDLLPGPPMSKAGPGAGIDADMIGSLFGAGG